MKYKYLQKAERDIKKERNIAAASFQLRQYCNNNGKNE